MVDKYNGQLLLECDGPKNKGAISRILDFVEQSVDYSRCTSAEERSLMQSNVSMALLKLNPLYTPRMVFHNFNIDCLVGFGAFGRIWKANGKDTGNVALKQIAATMFAVPGIWKERDVMIKLKNPRICNLLGAFYHYDAFLVMELCYGSVATLRNKITTKNAIRFSVHLLEAIQFIHAQNIIHADLKPDNCLIKTNNCLVVSDFGSAIVLGKEDQDAIVMPQSHGSPGYQDYDALCHLRFSKSTDIFSAACIIFEMDVKGTLLLYSNRQIHPRSLYIDALEFGRIIGLPPNADPELGMERETLSARALISKFGFLIQKMIHPDNQVRLTAEQALCDTSLRMVLTNFGVIPSEHSPDAEYVTHEFNVDTSAQFELYADQAYPEVDPAFLTFYYDEADQERPVDAGTSPLCSPSMSVDSDDSPIPVNRSILTSTTGTSPATRQMPSPGIFTPLY